ncbi:MAG: ATP-binding cassette domain-containing protein, partial [Streptosporangiaceae bacterium]
GRQSRRAGAGRQGGPGRQGGEDELLEMLPELRKCLGRKAGLLSGGEQQMLAVGRALVTRPRLLLVDEMSLGLAPVIVERLLPILRRAADELGSSVLFVEQHVALALEVADRAYVLTHGRIALEGPATELRGRRELLAASYLGESAA